VSDGDGTSTVTARASAQSGGDGSSLRFGIVREGSACATTPAAGSEATFPGLPDGEEYRFTVCVESWYDGRSFGRTEATEAVRAQQSGRAPRDWTFVVDAAPDIVGSRAEWIIRQTPTSTERLPNQNRVEFAGWGPGSGVFDRDPALQVRYVHERWGTATPWASITPRAGSAPYQVWARWWVETCVGGSDLVPRGESSNDAAGGKAAMSFANTGLRYFDASGAVLPHTADTWGVPVGAVRVEGVAVSADWSAQGWGLSPAGATFAATCAPNIPVKPGPP
jgi:hypothetical protein